jgi:hypothetical protein
MLPTAVLMAFRRSGSLLSTACFHVCPDAWWGGFRFMFWQGLLKLHFKLF